MIVEREKRHEAGGTREKIITFVDGKPRFEREPFPSLLRFAFQAIRDRSRLIPRTSLASASFLRSTFSTVPPSSPIVREIRRTRQLETTFLTCNVISYVPLALQRPETPGADNNETASATRSSRPLLPCRVLAGDASFRRRRSGNYIKGAIVRPALYRLGSAGFREARESRNKPGAASRASSRIEFRRLAGLVFSRFGERAHASPTRIKVRFAFARDSGKLETPGFLFYAAIAWKPAPRRFKISGHLLFRAGWMDNNVVLVPIQPRYISRFILDALITPR